MSVLLEMEPRKGRHSWRSHLQEEESETGCGELLHYVPVNVCIINCALCLFIYLFLKQTFPFTQKARAKSCEWTDIMEKRAARLSVVGNNGPRKMKIRRIWRIWKASNISPLRLLTLSLCSHWLQDRRWGQRNGPKTLCTIHSLATKYI